MKDKPVRILLVDEDPDDVQLLEEAFAEIEETRYSNGWMMACERVYTASVEEAAARLSRNSFDAILLDVSAPDSAGLPSFLRLRAEAAQTPVILLAGEEDETLALSLVRQGAQDYLIKSGLDCAPLARTLRCAIERNRLLVAQQRIALLDELTGLYNEGGLVHLGERHWKLAERHRLQVTAFVMELGGLDRIGEALGAQERDVTLIELADQLRDVFEETDLVARVASGRFAAVVLTPASANVSVEADGVRRKLSELAKFQVAWSSAMPSPATSLEQLLGKAEQALCENGLVASGPARRAAQF